jgi:RHS repeat-associated protein
LLPPPSYTTFGAAVACNLRFPGQYCDAETGKHYNYFRDYDPNVGRFSESDPIGLTAGNNTYGYVDSNPLKNFDLNGLIKHTAGQPKECGKNCSIRIDLVLDEKTGKVTRHIHWECRGKEGAAGEFGGNSHGGNCDQMPNAVRKCAEKHGFSCDPKPEPGDSKAWSCEQNCQRNWKLITDAVTGAVTLALVCIGIVTAP